MKNQNRDFFDKDLMRENIHQCCSEIFARSPRILEFILINAHKNAAPPQEEFLNYNELGDSRVLLRSVEELWLTLNGRPHFLPSFLENNKETLTSLTQIAMPIFIDEAQTKLQSQECTFPNNSSNLQHNQQTIPNIDENSEEDNNLQDL